MTNFADIPPPEGWPVVPPDEGDAETRDKPKGKGRNRPMIRVVAGQLAENMAAAVSALHEADVGIFDRGGILVRPLRVAETMETDGIKRHAGALVLRQVDPDWLRLRMSEAADWEKWDGRAEDWRNADPPITLARTIIAAPDEGNWPHLRAIVRHPVLAADGRWITGPGYDARSGLLVDAPGEWPDLPRNPSHDDAVAARLRIEHLLRNFPFVGHADRAVALSTFMTAVNRPVLPTAPGHAVDAPSPGTGKSLLIDAASILATGAPSPVLDYGRDADEAAKRLDGSLLAGDPMICLDNIEAPVEGAVLCQMLTQTVRRIRPLGSSTMATVPCVGMITFNGNNLTLRGDIVRRVLVCRLDAQCEQPELREFDQDILAEVRERRGELVRDLQIIALAYIRAGRPRPRLSPLGSFGEWDNVVRSPLVWAGAADPVAVMERTRQNDPTKQALSAVFRAWFAAFGTDSVPLSTVIAKAETEPALRSALELVAMRSGRLDGATLGYWCRKNRDAQSGKLVLRQEVGFKRAVAHWTVEGLPS